MLVIDKYTGTVLDLAIKMAPGLAKVIANVVDKYGDLAAVAMQAVDDNKDQFIAAFKKFDEVFRTARRKDVVDPPATGDNLDDFADKDDAGLPPEEDFEF